MKFVDQNQFRLEDYQLSPSEFLLKRKEHPKPIILDIRPFEQAEKGMIDGSHALPHEELEERLIQLPPFSPVILYSDQEDKNIAQAMNLLWENGFVEIFFIEGGYPAILKAIIEFTPGAEEKIAHHLQKKGKIGLQLDVQGYDYSLHEIETQPNVETFKEVIFDGWSFFFAHSKFRLVEGLKLDYQDGNCQVDHPRMHQVQSAFSLKDRVQVLLDEEINPSVASHGGHVRLIEVEDDVAYIEMGGGCQGCGMSAVTLKQGIEHTIFSHIPEITRVLDTTDHAAGNNPYYKP